MKKISNIKKWFIFFVPICFILLATITVFAVPDPKDQAPGRTLAQQSIKGKKVWNTTDHSKHQALQKEFTNGDDITKACISCHSEASTQFHKTIHWTWLVNGLSKDKMYGKAGDSINNFCISTNYMQDKSCLSCHTGWNGKEGEVNCLLCHGQKEINWREFFEDLNAFRAESGEDFKELADEIQSEIQGAVKEIGLPTRKNCGFCHFDGGGGDGVKHGDLDSSLMKPNKALDVHMSIDGQNFDCVRCHTTSLHNIAGRIYTAPAANEHKSLIEDDLITKITCESCHSARPHQQGSKANDHTDKVACQSCHIPTFAREKPTKISWDWSKAGKTKDGKKFKTQGPFEKHNYMSIKGEMVWDKNVKPEYYWFNGSINSMTIKDIIDPEKTVQISSPLGNPDSKDSRIFPFKVHKGRQPYDKVHNTLLAPLLSDPDGYWANLNWDISLTKGMAAIGMPYSGQFGFVDTRYILPITHMVAPKDNVVSCNECHTNENSRLKNLTGFYMPGRDSIKIINWFGWIGILGSFAGVFLHGLFRFISNKRRKEE